MTELPGRQLLLLLDLLLDLVAVPHVLVDVGSVVAVLLGLELGTWHICWGLVPADGELNCCCCFPRSTAALVEQLQAIAAGKRAQYRNIILTRQSKHVSLKSTCVDRHLL